MTIGGATISSKLYNNMFNTFMTMKPYSNNGHFIIFTRNILSEQELIEEMRCF